MRTILLISFILISSCQITHEKKIKANSKDDPQIPLVKIDASKLSVSLEAEDYENANLAGVLLKPVLDVHASHIAYEICLVDTNQCTNGIIIGLSDDVIYDAPNGDLKITYQACVQENRAISEPCGEKKSILFTHKVKNSAPLHLAP